MKRNKTYKCNFPNCNYTTNIKSQINSHHIKPKELGGSNNKNNLIDFCPTHHSKIYVKESKQGIHSFKDVDSIEIKHIYKSTNGFVMEYIQKGEMKYNFI